MMLVYLFECGCLKNDVKHLNEEFGKLLKEQNVDCLDFKKMKKNQISKRFLISK